MSCPAFLFCVTTHCQMRTYARLLVFPVKSRSLFILGAPVGTSFILELAGLLHLPYHVVGVK